MAVDPEDIHAISIALVQLYRDVELRLATLIASYIRRGIDAPAWMEERLAAIGDLRRAAGDILGQLELDASELLRQYIAEAYRTGWGAALTDIPEPIAAGLAQAAIAEVPRVAAMESLAAALIADVGERHANVLRHVIDVYRATIAQAAALSIGGGVTRLQASQDAYARLTRQGVAAFVDARGRTWRLSSYVEMAVRTVTQRAAVQGQTDRLQTLGLDLVIVSNSPRECPRCRPWEGKILSISGGQRGRVRVRSVTTGRMVTVDVAGTVDEARRAGLQHPNCTHSLRAYLPGATQVPRGDLSNPDGYEAKERQREIERAIRHWKERAAAALTPEARKAAEAKVRAWQAEMRAHLAANPGLKRLRYREQIGAGNIPRP